MKYLREDVLGLTQEVFANRIEASAPLVAADTCLDPDNVYRVQMAVDEAFSNIVEHAYAGEPEENFECVCQLTSTHLTVILTHHGRPFDPDQVKGPALNASLKERKEGGLGWFFMRKWMDDVRFEVFREAGSQHPRNVLTMTKGKVIDG